MTITFSTKDRIVLSTEGLLSVALVGEPPGRAHVQARARVQQALGVDAPGDSDERVDRGEHEHGREHVLPERYADERAPCRQDERRGEGEYREEIRHGALGVGAECRIAG